MAHAHHRRIALLLPLALTGFPVTTFQADSLPPLSTYAPGSPERVWLQSIHLHRKRDWKALAALYGSEWHRLYPGGTDADDPEDPRFFFGQIDWMRPVSMGPITRQQLSNGIVRVSATITYEGTGEAPAVIKKGERRTIDDHCRLYPEKGKWKLGPTC